MIISKNNLFERPKNKPIVFDIYKPEAKKHPLVIFCHGYKGFKDWGAWDLVGKTFAENGFAFVKFNFSHNGSTVEQLEDFPDLEAFAQNNYSKELQDVEDLLEHLITQPTFKAFIDLQNINLIGHSRGGGIALIKAAENKKIAKVVTWAGVSDYKSRFFEGSEPFKKWKQEGRMFVENGRTKQQMPHDWQFYEDFIASQKRLTIKNAVKAIKIPSLIVHGDKDPTVPFKEAQQLHQWNPDSNLVLIKEANHVFGASHPWGQDTLPAHLKEAVNKTIAFLK